MDKKIQSLILLLIITLLCISCSTSDNFFVLRQITNFGETNCYLLYDKKSKEAALFDVGGSIDSLISHIKDNNLKLKYIFATHCHLDHINGVPFLRQKYPNAKLCFNKVDFQDFIDTPGWAEKNVDPKDLEEAKQNPVIKKWFEFDPSTLGEIDIYLEDGQIYKLGNLKIKTILSPGHSRGSICYHVGDILFSGDVLFYRKVGRTDFYGGSSEEIVKSVRMLYTQLSGRTKVYPGHGHYTDIGSEKNQNEEVTISEVNLQN
jgi:glyoxylase-like metal-dependent hydrolase (beta-lactamase superfamily II)